jgi:hypothetical protein
MHAAVLHALGKPSEVQVRARCIPGVLSATPRCALLSAHFWFADGSAVTRYLQTPRCLEGHRSHPGHSSKFPGQWHRRTDPSAHLHNIVPDTWPGEGLRRR